MDRFKEVLEDCQLNDLGFLGDPFTWRNHSRDSAHYIRQRLDRAVATHDWCLHFPDYRVMHGDPRHSDHRPIIISITNEADREPSGAGPNGFRFEAKWLQEDNCDAIVHNAWINAERNGVNSVAEKLQSVACELKGWSKQSLGDLEKRISRLKRRAGGLPTG